MVGQGYYAADGVSPAEFVLRRIPGKDGSYELLKQFKYVHVGRDGAQEAWTIPGRPGQPFETDLASIPSLAGWLVPKDGRHTPAALVHDAMVLGPDDEVCYDGRQVSRLEADEIFRLGMQFLGVKFWRRWMIWAAVSIPTLWASSGESAALRLASRVRLAVGLLAVSIMGLFLLPDVLDFPGLPFYGFLRDHAPVLRDIVNWGPIKVLWSVEEGGLFSELGRFLAKVAAAALIYAVVWWRRWRFGLFAGVTVPLIAYSMAVGAVSYLVYWCIESLISLVLLVGRRLGVVTGRVPAPQFAQRITGEDGGNPTQGSDLPPPPREAQRVP